MGAAGGWEGAALGCWGAGTPKTGVGALGKAGCPYPAVLGQIAGKPVSPRVPMVEGLLLGSLCLSFPRQITIWEVRSKEEQGTLEMPQCC